MKENIIKIILTISVIFVLIISIIIGILLTKPKEEVSIDSTKNIKNMSEETQTDMIIIKNGNIENEKLIDEFIEKVSTTTEEIVLKIHEYSSETEFEEKQLTYKPGTYNHSIEQ